MCHKERETQKQLGQVIPEDQMEHNTTVDQLAINHQVKMMMSLMVSTWLPHHLEDDQISY